MSKLLSGQIGKPHGLDGEVFVIRISDDPRRFEPGSELLHENGSVLVVESSRIHGARFLVKFQGVETRESAEGLRGPFYADDGDRRDLDQDEYWHADLVGCTVVLEDGTPVGEVTGIAEAPAQDLLVLATEQGERMVPLVQEIVPTVDIAARRITITPPEGLLD